MVENGKRRRFFPDAFKLEAVAAVGGERSVSAVASELGLPDRLVRGWLAGWLAARRAEGRRGAARRRRHPPGSRRRQRAAWGRARPTRRRRSRGCGASSTACGWSATS